MNYTSISYKGDKQIVKFYEKNVSSLTLGKDGVSTFNCT